MHSNPLPLPPSLRIHKVSVVISGSPRLLSQHYDDEGKGLQSRNDGDYKCSIEIMNVYFNLNDLCYNFFKRETRVNK